MRLLGIDYGEKNVGIAVSDDKAMMAFPRSVLPNNKKLLDEVIKFAKEEDVSTIIVGDSMNYKGEANRIMDKAKPFAAALQAAGFEVVFESELLSSHQASHFMGKTDKIDASAASIILQSYIDRMYPKDPTND